MLSHPPRLRLAIFEDNVANGHRNATEPPCCPTILAKHVVVAGTSDAALTRPILAALSVMFVHPPPVRVTEQHTAKSTASQCF